MHRGRVVSFNPLDVGAYPTTPLQLDYPRYEKREFKEWLKGPEEDKAEEWDQWFDSLSKDVQDYWLALSGEDQIHYSFKTKLLKKKAIEDPIDPFKLIESEYEYPEEFYEPVKFEDNGDDDDDEWERLPQHEASGLIGLLGRLGPRRRFPGPNIPRGARRALSKVRVDNAPESFKNVLRVVDAQSMEVADSITDVANETIQGLRQELDACLNEKGLILKELAEIKEDHKSSLRELQDLWKMAEECKKRAHKRGPQADPAELQRDLADVEDAAGDVARELGDASERVDALATNVAASKTVTEKNLNTIETTFIESAEREIQEQADRVENAVPPMAPVAPTPPPPPPPRGGGGPPTPIPGRSALLRDIEQGHKGRLKPVEVTPKEATALQGSTLAVLSNAFSKMRPFLEPVDFNSNSKIEAAESKYQSILSTTHPETRFRRASQDGRKTVRQRLEEMKRRPVTTCATRRNKGKRNVPVSVGRNDDILAKPTASRRPLTSSVPSKVTKKVEEKEKEDHEEEVPEEGAMLFV